MTNDLKIADPVDEDEVITYRDHFSKAEKFTDDINELLYIGRAFRHCEAMAILDWQGQVVLVRNDMTSGMTPNGPLQFTANCRLPMPWMIPKDKRMEIGEILDMALARVEEIMIQMCAKAKVVRVSWDQYSKNKSMTIATATAVPANGRSRIIQP